jgi:hypothetical protein
MQILYLIMITIQAARIGHAGDRIRERWLDGASRSIAPSMEALAYGLADAGVNRD